jgi:hypothetical protein
LRILRGQSFKIGINKRLHIAKSLPSKSKSLPILWVKGWLPHL